MNKVEQLIIEAIQQSLSALDKIDVAALQGRCTPFADERCRLDNLPTLLRHCKRYYEASLRNDTEQVMQSRRDINVYTHTMGFTPEGNDSLLKLLSGEGEKIPSPPPPPPPPPSPLPPINPGGGGHLPPQKSKISPFVFGLVAIAVCFVLGLVWILNQEPKSAPSSKPEEASIPTSKLVEDSTKTNNLKPKDELLWGNQELLKVNSRYFAFVEWRKSGIYWRTGQVHRATDTLVFKVFGEESFVSNQENKSNQQSMIGEIIAQLSNKKSGLSPDQMYFWRFPAEYSEDFRGKKVREISDEHQKNIPPIAVIPPGLWIAIEQAREPKEKDREINRKIKQNR